jgi:lysophospholipase L1-like esterase
MYAPSDDYVQNYRIRDLNREFYKSLAQKYGTGYIDLTEDFLLYPATQITLLPINGHLSRFGNQVIAQRIKKELETNNYRTTFTFANRPKIMGDLAPNSAEIWNHDFRMPFRVFTNRQGFRNGFDVYFPKKKQRILVLGDSYTFGQFLPNQDLFTDILNREFQDKEFLNAGICGFTITDEVSLFTERAKYSQPDITILQVLDNDIHGLFYFMKNTFDRKGRKYSATPLEKELLSKIREP